MGNFIASLYRAASEFCSPPPSPTRFHKNSKKHPTPPHPKPPPHRSNPQIEQMLLTLVGWGLGVGAWGGMFKNKKKNGTLQSVPAGQAGARFARQARLFFSFFPFSLSFFFPPFFSSSLSSFLSFLFPSGPLVLEKTKSCYVFFCLGH